MSLPRADMSYPTSPAAKEPRDRALAALYQAEQRQNSDLPSLTGKAGRYVRGVLAHRLDLDRRIEEVSEGWPLHRMPVVDRTILRLGLYELLHEPTPTAVILNEAVELAKRYSTSESGKFVNGVLATLSRSARPE